MPEVAQRTKHENEFEEPKGGKDSRKKVWNYSPQILKSLNPIFVRKTIKWN
jgi:hypothetical protein